MQKASEDFSQSFAYPFFLRLRKSFYSAPLFLQWLPALYWEKEKSALEIARYALGIFILFGLATLFSLLLRWLAFVVSHSEYNQHIEYAIFLLQIFWTFAYLFLSFVGIYKAWSKALPRLLLFFFQYPLNFVDWLEAHFHKAVKKAG